MSPGVFDAGTAERLRERINQDGAFHQVSSDMTLNLALETDGAARLVTFRDGTLTVHQTLRHGHRARGSDHPRRRHVLA